jgi:hypothetical protein
VTQIKKHRQIQLCENRNVFLRRENNNDNNKHCVYINEKKALKLTIYQHSKANVTQFGISVFVVFTSDLIIIRK